MGKASQGVFGFWRGKVGNVVGRVRQGQNVYSIYQPSVANPRTPAQVTGRSKFTLISQLISTLLGFIKVGFASLDGYVRGSAFSSAVGLNLKTEGIVTGTYPNLEIDYSKVKVSDGKIDLPFNPSGSAEGNILTVSWADNSGRGDALATDKAMVLAYNSSTNECVFDLAVADRSARTGTLTMPTVWSGDTVEVWLAMERPDTKEVSDSTYLGSFTL